MAIKHEDVVEKGDLLTSTMWNKPHIIEDFTIKGIHIDNLQIGTDHLLDDCVTTPKLAIQDWLDLVNRLTDPTLAVGRLWFREDLVKLRFSPDGTTVKEIAWAGDLTDHATTTPIDHPDLSVVETKIADAAITPAKLAFGTWEKVGEITGTATVYNFTGLDLAADKIYRLDAFIYAAATGYLYLEYNGDTTTTNYYRQRLIANGTSISAARHNTSEIYYIAGGEEGVFTFYIVGRGAFTRAMGRVTFEAPPSVNMWLFAHAYNKSVNVTSVQIRHSAANGIGVYSKAVLWRAL